ncbi:hypothetical protein O6H91_13G027400 [Diphasiastrum complanatum]|uniref:Uncharacterized protein n=1 Tax=Diphasiastrum complanatum TaxID=34168 RepID=A0ACC2BTF3_DIPCM|nr:hypothetical protein O6H91_13G027400 [Diphasiastrum complanatum]
MAEFAEMEAVDGVRMPWNVWPSSRVEASKCVVPLAAVITPLRALDPSMSPLPYGPPRCKTCRSVLNPFCRVDFAARLWICPFCFQRNHFPPHYASISESNLPAELFPQYTTLEYVLPGEIAQPPVFMFVLDTCLPEEELGFLKTALTQAIVLLPEKALVGLITYGTHVHVHELGFGLCPKSYVFRGSKEVTKEQILDQLGLAGRGAGPQRGVQSVGVKAGVWDGLSGSSISRFLLPASDCEFTVTTLLDELQRDAFPIASDERPARSTGTALTVAAGLLGACLPGTGARILAFVGGPCTEGSGTIVAKELSETIRSHKDLAKDAAPKFTKAVKFYDGLAKQLANQGHVLDLFACALDQVGVAEMKVAVERSGGLVVLAESFGHSVFKDSFKRIFQSGDSALGLSFSGIFEVSCSKDVRILGTIGPCASLEKKGPACGDTVVGEGNTTAWKMCGIDRNTSLAVFFEVASSVQQTGAAGVPIGQQFFLQFLTGYQHADGQMMLRATTVTRRWVDGTTNPEELLAGFDQEAAAVIMARLASFKMENEVFNNSPDETAYFRMVLNRENVTNSLVMIQPSLISYSINAPPEPALLDVAAIAVDRILLLDAYFSVVIFHGMTIAQWRAAGYHNQPEYEAFAQLLQAPRDDVQAIIKERFPVPRLVDCDQHKSQARFLLAKLNPSATYNSAAGPPPGGDIIFTDDVSLQVFMEHLQKLAVQS